MDSTTTWLTRYQKTGAKLRKSTVDAVSLPRSASSRPRHHRHRPRTPAEAHHPSRVDPRVREMARPGAQGDFAQGVAHPGPDAERLPDPRPQR